MNIGTIKIQVDFLGTWNKGHNASLHLHEASEKCLGIDGRYPAYIARFKANTSNSIPKWSQRIEFVFPTEYTWEELEDKSLMATVKNCPCQVIFTDHKGKVQQMQATVDLQFGSYYKQ